MLIRLQQVFEIDGRSEEFSLTVSSDDCREYDNAFLAETLIGGMRLEGTVANRAGVVTLDYRIAARLKLICDRCADEFEREYGFRLTHTLVTGFSNETDEARGEYDDYIVCPDLRLDIAQLAICDLTLMLPTKTLCSEDCKGLSYR